MIVSSCCDYDPLIVLHETTIIFFVDSPNLKESECRSSSCIITDRMKHPWEHMTSHMCMILIGGVEEGYAICMVSDPYVLIVFLIAK